mmetsp:Transcript_6400/g.9782  ORF Transcript_6400/g.9782 Transcript_6400/m.9782 type:complete len:268 (+) Transcript_6400:402-1205(+)
MQVVVRCKHTMKPSVFHLVVYSLLCACRVDCFFVHNTFATASTTRLHLQNGYLQSLESNNIDTGKASTEGCYSDPYAPGVAEEYGLIGNSGVAGFDEASDSVGPGIYGGSVQRDVNGDILIGTQYENHNHVPGPLYDGNGYSLMGRAIHIGKDKVNELLDEYPQLLEEISTGGARPLHICGMSERGQHCTQTLIDAGADIFALDTYNYNALHRMASNDLEIGAEALVQAGVDPNSKDDRADSTPIDIAKRQRAIKFLMKMQKMGHYD